jgi:hypothetical protein
MDKEENSSVTKISLEKRISSHQTPGEAIIGASLEMNTKNVEDTPVPTSPRALNSYRLLRGDTMGCVKTIQRRGKSYMIKDDFASEEDQMDSEGPDKMISDLYEETLNISITTNRKASIFKILYVLSNLFMIIAGSVIGILSLSGDTVQSYISSILGFLITGIQTSLTTFSIEKRGVLLKEISSRLRRISRNLKILQNSDIKARDKIKKLEEFYAEVDELDLSIFDNNITSKNVKPVNLNISEKPNNSSGLNSEESDESDKSSEDNKKEGLGLSNGIKNMFRRKKRGILPTTIQQTV